MPVAREQNGATILTKASTKITNPPEVSKQKTNPRFKLPNPSAGVTKGWVKLAKAWSNATKGMPVLTKASLKITNKTRSFQIENKSEGEIS